MTFIPVNVELCEEPVLDIPDVEGHPAICELVARAVEARNQKRSKNDDRQTMLAVTALLENPLGLSKRELLIVAESDNFISLVGKIRNKVGRDGKYKLASKGKGDAKIYCLVGL